MSIPRLVRQRRGRNAVWRRIDRPRGSDVNDARQQGFCRAGRIRTADLLTPREGRRTRKVLVTASIHQRRRSEPSTGRPHFS
jgi:hypothetical protein